MSLVWRRTKGWGAWLFLPGLLLVGIAFVYPIALLFAKSFAEPPGGLAHYDEFLASGTLVKILGRTVLTAGVVTTITLVIGYPVAYLISTSGAKARVVLLGLVGGSLFTSVIVRSYAWLAILDRGGLVDETLARVGLDSGDIALVHNFTGVVIGMTQYTVPFMIFALYNVMRNVDARLLRSAAILGAKRPTVFRTVYLPLTLPGVAAGCAIVFVVTLGYFIIPSILGGPQNMMIGEVISDQIRITLNWGLGGAIASIILVVALACFAVFYSVERRYGVWRAN